MDRFIMENPIKIDDLGVLPILGNLKIIMFCLYLPWLPSDVASVVGEEPSRGPLFLPPLSCQISRMVNMSLWLIMWNLNISRLSGSLQFVIYQGRQGLSPTTRMARLGLKLCEARRVQLGGAVEGRI